MDKTQHTPGPWVALEDVRDFGFGAGGELVGYDIEAPNGFEVVGAEGIINSACAEANARLIAAAPDLLVELRNLVGWLDGMQRFIQGEFLMDELLDDARAAIAKAEGSTNA